MRSLVQPSPSMRCEFCEGELLFKRLEPDNPAFDTEVQIFVCTKCGRPHSRKVVHDPYTRTSRASPRATATRPRGSD